MRLVDLVLDDGSPDYRRVATLLDHLAAVPAVQQIESMLDFAAVFPAAAQFIQPHPAAKLVAMMDAAAGAWLATKEPAA